MYLRKSLDDIDDALRRVSRCSQSLSKGFLLRRGWEMAPDKKMNHFFIVVVPEQILDGVIAVLNVSSLSVTDAEPI